MNKLYEEAPVSESLPGGEQIAINATGYKLVGSLRRRKDSTVECEDEHQSLCNVTHILRPVTLTMPEGCMDGEIENWIIEEGLQYAQEEDAYKEGAERMHSHLLPLFAAQQAEIDKLKGDVELWKRTADRHFKDCDSFIATNRVQQERIKALEGENEKLKDIVDNPPKFD